MHVSNGLGQGPLDASAWDLLNEQALRLEKAWQQEASVDLGRFLPAPDSPLRRSFLHELIKTELALRWRARRPMCLEDYLQRFPELGDAASLPADLIYEEYRARHLYGDRPQLELYQQRFPRQQQELLQLIEQYPLTSGYPTLSPFGQPGQLPPSSATPHVVPSAPSTHPGASVPLAESSLLSERVIPSEGYTIEGVIGSGQFGAVFRARAPGGVEVAVKRIFRPMSDESSQRELRALEQIRCLRHPFLLQTHTYWSLRDRLIIVMELADGSLMEWFKECKAAGQQGIPAAELIAYFKEAAEALDYLHSQNLIHRDVKPANLLRLKGHAKVADFGLVRLQEDRVDVTTVEGGTPAYMPPEAWRKQITRQSDQYSLAIAYAEMRLGRRMVLGSTLYELAMEHERGTPDLRGMEPAERDVVLRALAKNPEKRFPTCSAFLGALAATVLSAAVPPPATPRRWVWKLGLAATILAALLAVAAVFYHKPSPEPVHEPQVVLPGPGFEPDTAADVGPPYQPCNVGGKSRPNRIRYRLEGTDPLVFFLIEADRAHHLPAFYILRDKVSYAQFTAMVRTQFERLCELLEEREKELAAGHMGRLPRKWANADWLPKGAEWTWPAVNITVTEAHCFAECLGGRLPQQAEWDKAGGRYDGEAAPHSPTWEPGQIAIKLDPGIFRPIGTSPADRSRFSCRDMSGNGYEWTCDVRRKEPGPGSEWVPLPKPDPRDLVLLRGQPPQKREPLAFDMLNPTPPSSPYDSYPPYIGFRVVIPLGEP